VNNRATVITNNGQPHAIITLRTRQTGRGPLEEHVVDEGADQVVAEPKWADLLTDADPRALSPLFWTHVIYGRLELDRGSRLDLHLAARKAAALLGRRLGIVSRRTARPAEGFGVCPPG
jgi:hypothetical protein